LCLLLLTTAISACATSSEKGSEIKAAQLAAMSTYEASSEGVTCKDNWSGKRVCTYEIGKGLKIRVKGVGRRVPRIFLLYSTGKKGDFYPSVISPTTGCITIHRGKTGDREKDRAALADLAFISMGDGGVYQTLEACLTSSKIVKGWILEY
jgi:hypothetical protein